MSRSHFLYPSFQSRNSSNLMLTLSRFVSAVIVGTSSLGGFASEVSAADGNKINLEILLGLSFPSISSVAFGYGLKADYRLQPTLLAGLFYYHHGIGVQTNSGTSTVSASTTNVAYGLEGIMNFTGGFSGGVKVGLLKVVPDVVATDALNTVQFTTSSSYLFAGPAVSYEYPLGPVSVGGEVSYFYTLSSDAPKILNFLASCKISF